MSTISAGTTITTSLVQTGDLTGELVLKTDTSNTAVTINGVGAIGFGSTPDYGTAGQFMRSGGVAGVPSWQTVDANQWVTSGSNISYTTGNVGIGTSSPTSSLVVAGAAASPPTVDGVHLGIQSGYATIELCGSSVTGSIIDFTKNGSDYLGRIVYFNSTNSMSFATNGVQRIGIDSSGMVLPSANNTYDLGSTSFRWRNIYTNDLHLSNGIGDYTVVEGEEDLFLYNNKSGKTFKFALIEVNPSEAPPKAKT
jgi:hypothetical protein